MTKKIYIHMIDGTDIWIPVDAEQLAGDQLLIKTFDDFDTNDTSVIPQFIPGDIVTSKRMIIENKELEKAELLVKPSDNKDKKYIEFLYRTITGDKLKDDNERQKYQEAINKTRKEIEDGKFHYPKIVDYINGI